MEDENVRRACMIIALQEIRDSLEDPPHPSTIDPTRQPRRERGEGGAAYIHRLLTETPTDCKTQLRLDRDMFVQLVNLMIERDLLHDGKYVKVAEQVGICLYILAKGLSYRDASDNFMHSISTICKYFNQVLEALVKLSFDIIRPHRNLSDVPPEVENDTRYWPYFKDAIGALDGTLIDAVVCDKNGVPFRDRHGIKSWNVLACCSFDRIYTFINVGWEGSAHDITVWKDSLTDSKFNFPHPPTGKYYLADSAYPNTLGYMSPYIEGGVRVHMPEFRKSTPRGLKEHFNKLHSSLRMKVECSFGQLKIMWKILNNMPQVSLKSQMSIIVATFTLHNFIRMHTLGIPIIQHNAQQGVADSDVFAQSRKDSMAAVRHAIAKQIWMANRSESDNEDDDNVDHMEVAG